MTRSFILSLAAFAAVAAVGQAQAQTMQGGRVVEDYSHEAAINIHHTGVGYADLDLSSAAGRDTLYGRIQTAADRVCGPTPTQGSERTDVEDYRSCRDTTIAQTMTLVRGPERVAMAALAKRRAADLALAH